MLGPDYEYEAQQLSDARRALMAPHPGGESHSFAAAFAFCSAAFERLDMATVLDDTVRSWVGVIDAAIDTAGLQGSSTEARWKAKAAQMPLEEATRFATAVDNLAEWLERQYLRRKFARGDDD